jgi:transcriptional regulator with PAS, ATPase and Fis domain/tetratricopeptide (TPR) repeat protein
VTAAPGDLSALLARLDDELAPEDRAQVEAQAGRAYLRHGAVEPALRHLVASRRTHEALGDERTAAELDVDIALVCLIKGELDRADAFLERALDHAASARDDHLRARALAGQAAAARAKRDDAADALYAEAAAIATGDLRARALAARAELAADRDDLALARSLIAGVRASEPQAAVALAIAEATIAWRAGDPASAAPAFRHAIALATEHELRRDLAEAHLRYGLFCGDVAERLGAAVEPPAPHLARAQDLFRAIGGLGDLERVRDAFRHYGRRATDRVAELEIVELLGELKQQRLAVQDAAGRLSDLAVLGSDRERIGGLRAVEDALGGALRELALAEERFVAAVNAVVVERESIRGLLELTRRLAAVSDYHLLPDEIARLACQLTGADRGVCWLTDGGRGAYALDLAADRAWSAPVAEASAAAGKPQLLGGRASDRVDRLGSRERRASTRLGSAMAAPLRLGGRVLGAIWVDKEPSGGVLSERDLDLFAVFAGQAATILDNARIAEALRLAARTTAATLEAISDGVVSIDRSGAVKAMNATASRILSGRSGRGAAIVEGGREGPPLLDFLRADLERGEELDGRLVPLAAGEYLCNTRIIKADDGAPVGLVATFTELGRATRLAQRMVGSTARYSFADLAGRSPALRRVLALAEAAASSDASVLLTGESGTGKEVLAQAIHNAGPRAAGPFVAVNCAAIPRDLLESELFGYESGAFTGARKGGRPGKFELADNGTILLDEIGDMPLDMQVKLLRVLQERVTTRLGGAREIPLSCRIIATTNRDLAAEVQRGLFRQDLYFRLRVIHVEIPPLRDRQGDIAVLAEFFLKSYADRLGKKLVRVAPEVLDAFMRYPWPGNVRELEYVLESEVTLASADKEVLDEVPASITPARPAAPAWPQAWGAQMYPPPWAWGMPGGGMPMPMPAPGAWPWQPGPMPTMPPPPNGAPPASVKTIEDSERELLVAALTTHRGRIPAVARSLGISRGTVYNKMRKFNLDPDSFR